MKKWCTLLALLLPALGLVAGDQANLDSFQKVWETVNQKHWDLEGLGVDWQAVYEEYKPRVQAAESKAETRKILTEMLGELGQSHFQIMESDKFEALESIRNELGTGTATPGFEVALVEDRVFIVEITPTGAAANQELTVGTEILKINEKPLPALVTTIKTAFANSNHADMYINETLNQLFRGYDGGHLRITIAADPKPVEVNLRLKKPAGRFVEIINLSVFFSYESRLLANSNIGYVHFNVFIPDVKMAFDKDLKTTFADTDGLIIDLRGNPGGLGFLATAIARRLVDEDGKRLGHMINAGGTLNFAIFPERPIYDKPVAVLIDAGSASTSEILAAGLQDLDRAHVFGTQSAGAALPSYIEVLPNGDRFQYAIADYVSFKGRHLEGKGVEPDTATPHTLETMRQGIDATLQTAVDLIQTSAAKGEDHEDL